MEIIVIRNTVHDVEFKSVQEETLLVNVDVAPPGSSSRGDLPAKLVSHELDDTLVPL